MDRPAVIRVCLARATRADEPPDVVESLHRDYYAARACDDLGERLSSDPGPTPAQRRELAGNSCGR